MAVLTNFLKLLKPEKNDYVDVDKHISENYDKIDNKMQELNTSNSGKLDKGALPTTIKSGKDLYDMLENNGGINIDTALLYLNDTGTKTAGKVYFDKNKKGLFECIKTTTNTVNSTEFFVDISNKASADRLTNLITTSSRNLDYSIELHDVEIGNVYICYGRKNMTEQNKPFSFTSKSSKHKFLTSVASMTVSYAHIYNLEGGTNICQIMPLINDNTCQFIVIGYIEN